MNTHKILLSPAISTVVAPKSFIPYHIRKHTFESLPELNISTDLEFRKITPENMENVWKYLKNEAGRTTDFSYGGMLMWVDFFHYEYAILNDTLFIKGRVESDRSKVAFSMPVGRMPLRMSLSILRKYCENNDLPLIFSAVPEYALEEFKTLNPQRVEELTDWADYLYSAESLSTLKGKKYGKKRNHVNQFLASYPDYTFEPLDAVNAKEAIAFMDLIDAEGDQTEMAIAERSLNRRMLQYVIDGDREIIGGILRDKDRNILGFTMGDVKGDTLFVHIEKALRSVPGGFEMLNKTFAENVVARHPEIQYINREDDAGDEGLRYAKQSYHPLELLRKYNIEF